MTHVLPHLGLHKAVLELLVDGHCQVGGYGPGCRGPDGKGGALQVACQLSGDLHIVAVVIAYRSMGKVQLVVRQLSGTCKFQLR